MKYQPSRQHLTQPRPNEDPIEGRRRLNERLRAEFIAGAEADDTSISGASSCYRYERDIERV